MLDSWQIEDGLPQNSGYSIIQTHDGFIWIGTQEGLARFDGVNFVTFNRQNTPALKSNWIRCLFEDSKNNLWIGTNGGGITVLSFGKFINIPAFKNLPDNKIRSIAESPDGTIWIGTDGGGLGAYRDGNIDVITAAEGLTGNRINAICIDDAGTVYAGAGSGLNVIKRNQITTYTSENGLNNDAVMALCESRSGSIWIGTDGGGINIFRNGIIENIDQTGITDLKIRSLFEDKHNALWIGTEGGGINRYLEEEFSSLTQEIGLTNNSIFSFSFDREGSMWIGTHGGGINRLRESNFTVYSTIEGLISDDIFGVLEDRHERLWIGTLNGPVIIQNGKIINKIKGLRLTNKMVISLYEDQDGNMWFGTIGGGVFKYGKYGTRSYSTKNGLSNDRIYGITGDRKGNIWVGTWNGLNKISSDGITKYGTEDGLTMDKIRCILEDSEGVLWIGTDGGGLNRLVDGVFSAFTTENGLSSNFISSLYEDTYGTLWIGLFDGGLARYKNGILTNYTKEDGLFDNAAYQILEDNNGYLWFSSNHGIYKVRKSELNEFAEGEIDTIYSISYDRSDGMRSRECNGGFQPAGWKSKSGMLWFPTVRGLVQIDPDNISSNTIAPSVSIGEIQVDDQVVKNTLQSTLDNYSFPPGKSRVEIKYTGLSLIDPQKIQFKYMLEGEDEDWNNVGNRRTAYYTSLEPGDYTFRVIAANNDGVWNLKGDSFSFTLQPYFYQTKWFYGVWLLIIAGIIYGFYKLRINRLDKRRIELEELVTERTKQLQVINEEFKRLSNEDGMTGIANHRKFREFLVQEWLRAIRTQSSISLILFDVDKFKDINDNFGHQAGDNCLKSIANNLVTVINRPGDLAARYAGDEFVVILPETNFKGVERVAENLRRTMASTPVIVSKDGSTLTVTISIGYATVIPLKNMDVEVLIKAADDYLYEAKRSGRNRIAGKDLNSLNSLTKKPVSDN